MKACLAVRKARAKDEQHLGDLLYCALVGTGAMNCTWSWWLPLVNTYQAHSIDQIVATVVRQNGPFQSDKQIDLRFPMRGTGAWNSGARLEDVVNVAISILRLYEAVDPSDAQLTLAIFKDFEIIWLEVISPMFDNQPEPLSLFARGGSLDKKLLGHELYQKLRTIRTSMKEDRGHNIGGDRKWSEKV
jgi:hypothetical protein